MTHWPLCDLVSRPFWLSIGRYSDTFIVYQRGCRGKGCCCCTGFKALEQSAHFAGTENPTVSFGFRRCWP